MTEPTITYGHGKLYDFDTVSGWTEHEDGQTGSFSVSNNDMVDIYITGTGGNAEYYIDNNVNLGLMTLTHKYIRYRYRTSDTNIKAKIVVEFNDATTQEILADASSTTWVTGVLALTTLKTVDHIRLYADHAVGHVYYDYVLIYEDTFTFPNAESITVLPSTDLARTAYAGRVGRAPQTMGADDTKILINVDLDAGDWKRTGDTIAGEVFFDIAHNGSVDEAWQWLTTGHGHAFKARLETPQFIYSNNRHLLTLTLYEYRLGSADDETYKERFGI